MAKQYKIMAKSVNGDSVHVDVKYIFTSPDVASTQMVDVNIGLFRPQSLQDIEDAIVNRANSELQSIQAAATVSGFYNTIIVNTDWIDLE